MTEKSNCNTETMLPLQVLVMWHPDFEDGKLYADEIFKTFSRDEKDFCGQSIGIPVYYINSFVNDASINVAEKIIIIPLIDEKMILDNSRFKEYVDILCSLHNHKSQYIVFPVTFIDVKCISNMPNISKHQCIRLRYCKDIQERKKLLLFSLAHEFCRFFNGRYTSYNDEIVQPSVNIFVSHASEDGKIIAKKISDFIQTQTGLKSFIDINDIPCGSDFQQSIINNVKSSILLILFTDKYSTREWCQRELLCAKENGCPVVLLDALDYGETRSFPYSANVKTLHMGYEDHLTENRIKEILFEILIETIRIRYNEQYLKYIVNLYNQSGVKIFSTTPELLTLLSVNTENNIVLYPDPALNCVELDILYKFKPNYTFVTPTLLASNTYLTRNFLSHKNIGISISELDETGDISKTNTHLSAFYIELCRYLLSTGSNLCYGGNINYNKNINFVEMLKQLVNNYCFDYNIGKHIKWYYLSGDLTDDQKLEANFSFDLIEIIKSSSSTSTEDNANNLTKLRNSAISSNNAQIIIAGKTINYKGKLPGVLEETLIAIENKIPLYVIGAYGGIAELVANKLLNKPITNIEKYEYAHSFNRINMDSLNNGLSKCENIELCTCSDISRTVSLILKGLSNLYNV